MQRGAVVPHRDDAGFPAQAAGEFGPGRVRQQIFQQRRAFRFAPALEAFGMTADIEQFAAGFGMGADGRMRRD